MSALIAGSSNHVSCDIVGQEESFCCRRLVVNLLTIHGDHIVSTRLMYASMLLDIPSNSGMKLGSLWFIEVVDQGCCRVRPV
jgi:hypothetical protein